MTSVLAPPVLSCKGEGCQALFCEANNDFQESLVGSQGLRNSPYRQEKRIIADPSSASSFLLVHQKQAAHLHGVEWVHPTLPLSLYSPSNSQVPPSPALSLPADPFPRFLILLFPFDVQGFGVSSDLWFLFFVVVFFFF